jgi:hypothetical protein
MEVKSLKTICLFHISNCGIINHKKLPKCLNDELIELTRMQLAIRQLFSSGNIKICYHNVMREIRETVSEYDPLPGHLKYYNIPCICPTKIETDQRTYYKERFSLLPLKEYTKKCKIGRHYIPAEKVSWNWYAYCEICIAKSFQKYFIEEDKIILRPIEF